MEILKDKLQVTQGLNEGKILKEYFSEYPANLRNKMQKDIRRMGFTDVNSFNDKAYEFYRQIEQKKTDDMPKLLDSIMFNTLGWESNEALKYTCYIDYKNKNISKFAKPFIQGQYEIFRNEHEQLLGKIESKTQSMLSVTEKVCKIILKKGLGNIIELEELFEAYDKNPKSINGIVKKILKKQLLM